MMCTIMSRTLAPSFVAMPPMGTSTQTRLDVTPEEDELLWRVYEHGGGLRARDLRFLTELKALEGSTTSGMDENAAQSA